jgi:tetratricopeptide (TPR) repeat protein
MQRLLLFLLVLAQFALASAALAQNAEANQRIEHGEQLFNEGDYDGALAEFERAYEIIGEHPNRFMVLYNIGRCHERKFRYDLALQYYRRYLAEGGAGAPDRAQVDASIRQLEGTLATITISSNVSAEVWSDDRQIGVAPGDVLVPGGRHVIELRASGYGPERREVQIAPRDHSSLSFELISYGGVEPLYFGLFSGLAVLTAAAGAGVGIYALMRRDELEQELMDPIRMWEIGDAEEREMETLTIVADVLFGTAGLFAITAIVFAVFTNWGEETSSEQAQALVEPELRFAPMLGPNVAGGAMEVLW